jgi:hypothetical protein
VAGGGLDQEEPEGARGLIVGLLDDARAQVAELERVALPGR